MGKSQKAAAAFTDGTELSDDMLGDMDPDEYSSDDQSAQFKQKMKEWQEEQKKHGEEEAEEEEEARQGSTREDDGDGGDSGDEEARGPGPDEDEGTQDEDEDDGPGTEDDPGDEPDEEMDEEEAGEEEDLPTEIPVDEQPPPEEPSTPPSTREKKEDPSSAPDTAVLPVPSVVPTSDGRASKKDVLVPAPPPQEEKPAVALSGISPFVSLLTYDDGYIIADPRKEVLPPSADEKNLAPEPASPEKTARELIPPSLQARFKAAFEKMIFSTTDGEAREKLCGIFIQFGIGVLEVCSHAGVRVLMLPEAVSLSAFDGFFNQGFNSAWSALRFGYFPAERLLVLGEEVITGRDPRFSIPILYFSFAFDHSLGSEGFASERSPAVLANFQSCQRGDEGRQFIDRFSAESPIHYFAQAVEAFLTAPQGRLLPDTPHDENILCSKEQLYDLDRPMFTYVEYLLKQLNRPPT
jgi:hypothetical protein